MPQMMFSPCDPNQPTCSDATVGMLQHIFGPIIDVLARGADPNTVQASSSLLSAIFSYYNTGVLAVASLIISYVATVGTVNTANDGEAMGKQWSAPWTSMRIVTGGFLLLPSASGYSFLQMFVLTLALWSIGFANGIMKIGIGFSLFSPEGIVASSYQPGTYFGMRDFAKQYLAAAYCARSANALYSDPAGNPMVMTDSANPDRKVVRGTRTDYTFFVKDRNPVTNLAGGDPFCGTVTLTSYTPSGQYSDNSGTQAALDTMRSALNAKKVTVAMALMKDIDGWVATMPSDISQSGWDQVHSSKFNALVKAREDQIAVQIATAMSGTSTDGSANVSQGTKAFMDSMLREGWSMAGGWYQRVGLLRSRITSITSETVGEVSKPSLSALPSDARGRQLTSSVSTVWDAIITAAEKPENGYDSSTPRPEDLSNMLPKTSLSDINVGSLSNDVAQKASIIINNMMQSATNVAIGSGEGVDAISRMKLTGDLLASYRAMFLAAKFSINTTMTAARVVVSGIGGVQVLGTKVDESGPMTAIWDWLQSEIVSTISEIASYLGIMAFYFSVVLPSLPYTLFMITVVGWVLGVLQTVIAAPLWAVMHMRPSQSFVGSDQQGYLLLLALFVRPALAMIGLLAAMLTADPIVDYIAKAFFAMRGDVVASTGWVGAISQFFTFFWWFMVFGGILLPVLYMVYGLPQVLPDHVLKWINAGVHDLGATGASSAMQSRHAPMSARVGHETNKQLGALLNGSDPSGGRPGSGGAPERRELMNAGDQGVVPTAETNPGSAGFGESGDSYAAGGVGTAVTPYGGGPMSTGQQGTAGGSSSKPSRKASLSTRLSDGVGVAVGRAMTDGAMAVKDAAAGGAEGFAGRAGANLKDAMLNAGGQGVAAFNGGADQSVGAFKSEMAMRSALSGAAEAPASGPSYAGGHSASAPASAKPTSAGSFAASTQAAGGGAPATPQSAQPERPISPPKLDL